jgi:hypothetical protein
VSYDDTYGVILLEEDTESVVLLLFMHDYDLDILKRIRGMLALM